MTALFVIPLALLLDRVLGEPNRFHPLIGFGYLANKVEGYLNKSESRFIKGLFAWGIVVLPVTLIVHFLENLGGMWWQLGFAAFCGYNFNQ